MGGRRIKVMRIIARMNVGGPAAQAVTLMRGLDPDRYDQRLYSGFVGPGEADFVELRSPDIPVHRVPRLGRTVRPLDDGRTFRWLAAAMREFRPDIVHTHTAKAGALGRTAAMLTGTPARVHTFHGHMLYGYYPRPQTRLIVEAERALARITDRLIAVGTHVRDDLLAAGIGQTGQYAVVPPGTALGPLPDRAWARHTLGVPGDDPVVAYVGRLTQIKRPDRLVDVACLVHRQVPGVRFVVCGGGDAVAGVESAAADLDWLRPTGWRSDVETVYAAADLVILTSDNEGTPVSLIEAGMAGVPAVATRVGSVAEVVHHGQTGLLGRCCTEEIAHHTVRLLRDEPLRRAMGDRARAWTTRSFAPERLVADVGDVYASIAEQRGRRPARRKEEVTR